MICTFKAIHYCYLMFWKTFEPNVFKYSNLILLFLLYAPGLTWQATLRKKKSKFGTTDWNWYNINDKDVSEKEYVMLKLITSWKIMKK